MKCVIVTLCARDDGDYECQTIGTVVGTDRDRSIAALFAQVAQIKRQSLYGGRVSNEPLYGDLSVHAWTEPRFDRPGLFRELEGECGECGECLELYVHEHAFIE